MAPTQGVLANIVASGSEVNLSPSAGTGSRVYSLSAFAQRKGECNWGSGLLFFMLIRPQPPTPVWELNDPRVPVESDISHLGLLTVSVVSDPPRCSTWLFSRKAKRAKLFLLSFVHGFVLKFETRSNDRPRPSLLYLQWISPEHAESELPTGQSVGRGRAAVRAARPHSAA